MSEAFHTIVVDRNRCQGRMACMRACPTHAIRVRERRATLLRDRCIDCGECVRVCPSHAILPRTGSSSDFSKFVYTIAMPSPVFYSQFGKEVSPAALLAALRRIGFDDVCDVACASESVSIAIQEYLDAVGTPRPLLSPFCPVIVRLVQIRYPNLLDHLIPIDSPMEIAAREAKRRVTKERGLKESEIGVIYITPCPAKMLAIKQPPRKRHSFVNGTIALSAIYPTVLRALADQSPYQGNEEIRGLGLGWPILGGQIACLRAEDCLAIAGLSDAVRIFEEIENGKLRDIQYIEVHSCPAGCVGGPLTVENTYIARGRVLAMVQHYGGQPCQDREKIRGLYQKNFFSLPGKIPALPQQPLDQDVSKALKKMRQMQSLHEQLPGIDCGACGSPTCTTFAEDVVRGAAVVDDCVFLAMKQFESISATLLHKVRARGLRVREGTESNEQ
jgi:Na+-translocating ferredoxin:NAD+ oxidoreductase RNF subunit RnfB